MGSTTTDIQVTSVPDGQVVTRGAALPLLINARDVSKEKDTEVDVTLTSSTGDVVYHDRSAATLNQPTSIALPPGLAAGLYRLDIVIYSDGEATQKKSSFFFVAAEGWKIAGITSFPPLITTKASVLLKADLLYPAGADPWLRWSWKGKVIAKGTRANGFDQILWVAPSDEGVYTITLEMFPSSPASSADFPFPSTLMLSSDVFVANGKAQGKGDLGPESSYLLLLHLQGNLVDSGTAVPKNGIMEAVPVGNPKLVSLDDGFGYRLDGASGIRVPWLALPLENGSLKPFTLSIGIAFDDPATAGSIISARTTDGSFALLVTMDAEKGGPRAVLSSPGIASFVVPWSGPALQPAKRSLLSLSIQPQGSTMTAVWFLDGTQESSVSEEFAPAGLSQKGSVVVAGAKGFAGVVDELGVFSVDSAGRPSTDPGQFARAQADLHGSNLVFADGFDGTYLSDGFTLEGSGQIMAGTLTLKPGSSLSLPPVKPGGARIIVTAAVSPVSSRTAVLQSRWEAGRAAAPPIALAAGDGSIVFRVSPDGLSLVVDSGSAEKTFALSAPNPDGAKLVLALGNPAEARSSLALEQVLAVKDAR